MDLMSRRRALMAKIISLVKRVVTSATGLVSFNTNVEMPTKVTCEFSPVQEGTGDPSPDNARPISGWTGCNVIDTGYNLLNLGVVEASPGEYVDGKRILEPYKYYVGFHNSTVQYYYRGYVTDFNANDQGCSFTLSSYAIGITFLVKGGTQIRGSITGTNVSIGYIQFFDKDWNVLGGKWNLQDGVTVPANAVYAMARIESVTRGQPSTVSNYTIVYEAGTVEPSVFVGATLPINWALPDEYQEVEYIQTIDSAYIQTDIPARYEISYEAELELPTTGDQIFASCYVPGNTIGGLGYYNKKVQHWYGTYFLAGNAINGKAVYRVDLTNGSQVAYINGEQVETNSKTLTELAGTRHNVTFFGIINGDGISVRNMFTGKCYWAKVYVGGKLVGHFIPCYRKADDAIGMYDLVLGKFYSNANSTGTFTKGADTNVLPTIYGGTVTLNEDGSVDLISDKKIMTITGYESYDWDIYNNNKFSIYISASVNNITSGDLQISNYFAFDGNTSNPTDLHFGIIVAGSYVYIRFRYDALENSVENWKNWLKSKSDAGNPLQITIKLKTPETYHFPNIGQLNAFLGTNNIWHDMNGSITAEYWKKQ